MQRGSAAMALRHRGLGEGAWHHAHRSAQSSPRLAPSSAAHFGPPGPHRQLALQTGAVDVRLPTARAGAPFGWTCIANRSWAQLRGRHRGHGGQRGAAGFVHGGILLFVGPAPRSPCPGPGRRGPSRVQQECLRPGPGGMLLVVGPRGAKSPGQVQAERPGGVAEAKPPPWGAGGWENPCSEGCNGGRSDPLAKLRGYPRMACKAR